jgi:hypothetical protein
MPRSKISFAAVSRTLSALSPVLRGKDQQWGLADQRGDIPRRHQRSYKYFDYLPQPLSGDGGRRP